MNKQYEVDDTLIWAGKEWRVSKTDQDVGFTIKHGDDTRHCWPNLGTPPPEAEPTDILQATCPECRHECYRKRDDDDWLYCPECGAKLPQQSSEDASEGSMT